MSLDYYRFAGLAQHLQDGRGRQDRFVTSYFEAANEHLPANAQHCSIPDPSGSGQPLNLAGVWRGLHEIELAIRCDLLTVIQKALAGEDDPQAVLAELGRVLADCDCPAAEYGPHSVYEHETESCGGQTFDPPCGGCIDCIARQVAYAQGSAAGR
jgi:hypothetical protein